MKIFEITKHLNRGGRRARILALSLFLLILSVFSCANDAGIDDFTNPVISDSAEKIVFSGSLRLDGAVPGALSKISNENEVTGRSAFPSLVTSETSDVKYYISARATGPEGISEEIKGSVDQTAKSYSIGLTIGRTYTVTASLKKTLAGGRQVTVMEDEWENVTPSRTNTSLSHDFILKPVEGGNGSIKLNMTLPSEIDCPRLSDVSGDIHLSVQFKDTTTTTSATITGSDIPAGIYNITINFYKSSRKFLLYSIPQTINVFAGMETNTWQDDGSSNSPISAGKFVLTDEIIKNYQRTIFYVSEKDFTGKDIPDGQTRTGSPYSPFASLSDALNTIANNNKAEDYKIFIGGSLTGNTQISTLIKAENAKSLIIEGFTGNSSDCLVGDGSSSVLTVGSSVPLTIKNLRITGGNAEKGGGILIGDSAVVFLGNDLIITGNTASGLGGGVFAPNGVNVAGNLVITGNKDSSDNPSNLYLPAGKCVNVKGALTKGSEKAKIGISTADEPSLTNKIAFTLDYGKYNSSVAPGTYFTGDKWIVTAGSGTAAGEAVLAASGGNITIEPIYEDITINADKTTFIKSASSKVMTFTITGTGSSEVSIKNYAVSYLCENVPASFYETGTNTLKLLDSLPASDYIVSVTAEDSKGREYSASFSVEIKDIKTYTADEALTAISAMTTSGTITVTGGIDDNQVQEISSAINQLDSNILVKLDLSMTTGLSGQCSSFSGNDNIAEIILPDGITELPTERFRDCSNLSNIYIPASVSTINGWAFIYSPTGVTVADDSPYFKNVGKALYSKDGKKLVLYCDKLTEDSTFTVPAEVEEIGDFAFGNAKIKSINFESNTNLKTVGEHAFDRARNLISISFPDSVETIGDSCFQYTPSLSSIKLPASLKKVPSGFCNYSAAFTNIVIPDGVTEIEYAAFWGLDQLASVTLPASVTTITNGAFYNCKRPFTVNYKGTEAQKSLIAIDESDNEAIIGATWNCNYTGN